ncbi:MAG: 30S ribosomal protein S14 [Candidatus Aenigmatarchaeota archaeon]|nr:MAG: 30S ribosomal protein S14 [Candidatus Aenigmarchaeota archaeon]
MTYEDVKKQLISKPEKLKRYEKFCSPKKRKFGKTVHPCKLCGKTRGVIRKYGLNYCRQCFREVAEKLGFKKYQ